MKKIFFLAIIFIAFNSCTSNSRAKNYGGSQVIELKENERFINATWKETNLWILVEDTVTKEFYMREKSTLGIVEGKIIFKSKK